MTKTTKSAIIEYIEHHMNLYELACLITADLSEDEAKQTENQLISFLQEEGGLILSQASLFRKKLAYPIKKQQQAYLADIVFRLSSEKIVILENKIKSDNHILRHLLVVKKELKAMPERKRRAPLFPKTEAPSLATETTKEKKIELKDIDQKLEEILEKNEIQR